MDGKCLAVLIAAGEGKRLGWPAGKALAPLAGLPLFMHALRTLWNLPQVSRIVLVVRAEDREVVEQSAAGLVSAGGYAADLPARLVVIEGGATRQASVHRGLEALAATNSCLDDVVLVHDAARPLASPGLFLKVAAAAAAARKRAVAPGLPVTDSLRAMEGSGTVRVPREGLFRVQTPQGCRLGPLLEAHRSAAGEPGGSAAGAHDDLAIAEAYGVEVLMVEGEERNLKVTHPGDLTQAAEIAAAGRAQRVGLGFDVHPLRPGQGVRLGGVLIPCQHELEGHSDADVVAHAVMDALLGAAGAGDIGLLFPPGDERWRKADSIRLLESVWSQLAARGFLVGNVDITILAEAPKLSSHFAEMGARLAGAMRSEPWRVNVKATTMERLGFVGRGEGIAAMAIALLHGPGSQSATATATT